MPAAIRVRVATLIAALLVGAASAAAATTPAAAQPPILPEPGDNCLRPPEGVATEEPWEQSWLGFERAWPLTRGEGVTVAIVDTGVAANSPQLAGRVLPGVDLTGPGGSPADSDCFGHGTFIAGIIGAAPADGTSFHGVAPGVRILPIRVANSMNDGTARLLADGIRAAVDRGADVVNVSASTQAAEPSLVAAVEYAEQRDVVVVAAAANSAGQGSQIVYPAALPTVLAVGAIDSTGALAAFSQTGPHLGMTAPGVEVVSVGPGGPGHWRGSGTSYAVPFVVGVAALIRAYRPELSAAQVRHRLLTTADHPAVALPDPAYGWGVVNPAAAVSAALAEEGAAGAAVPAGNARHPDLPPPDPIGPTLAALAAGMSVVLIGLVILLTVLLPAGRARGWRPAARVTAGPDSSTGPAR